MGAPIVGLNDSGGANPGRRHVALRDDIFRNTPARRVAADLRDHARVPAAASTRRPSRISTSWSRARAIVDRSDVIKTVTHEDVTKEELGGAMTHNAKSGVAPRGRG